MSLLNPHANSVVDPNAARMAALIVAGNQPLTPDQLNAVRHLYGTFKARTGHGAALSTQQLNTLPDGTQVRIVSIMGRDKVFVAPPRSSSRKDAIEFFWGVPAHSTDRDGGSVLPSAYWKMRGQPDAMPDELTPARALDVSNAKPHPGHVTWTNPAIQADKIPVVISWRGPRDRYSNSSGWSPNSAATTGLTVVPHEESANDLGQKVLKDSAYVWINGRKLFVRNKIIAACVVKLSTGPDLFALRVLTDNDSGDLATYKLGCYDYVPAGETTAVPIGQLLAATALSVLNSYPSTLSTTALRLAQRPHFNRSGTQFAATRRFALPTGQFSSIEAVRVDPTTWTILQAVAGANDSVRSSASGSISDNAPTTPRVVSIDESYTDTTTDRRFLAVDFFGDTFTYVTWQLQRVLTRHTISEKNGSTSTDTGTVTDAYGLTVTHSTHGPLCSHAWNQDWTFSRAGTALTMGAFTAHLPLAHFIGDLSKDVFALAHGAPADTDFAVATGTYGTTAMPSPPFNPATIGDLTSHASTLTFDVWADGAVVAAATSGSFTDTFAAADSVSTGLFREYGVSLADQYLGSAYTPPVNSSTPRSGEAPDATFYDLQHIAVSPGRTAAYVAGHFVAPSRRYGLELAMFRAPPGGWTVAAVPAYAGGTRPTISAPVFTGVATQSP